MVLLLADLRQFVIIFLPFSFLNHTNCNLELTKEKHKTGQNKQQNSKITRKATCTNRAIKNLYAYMFPLKFLLN